MTKLEQILQEYSKKIDAFTMYDTCVLFTLDDNYACTNFDLLEELEEIRDDIDYKELWHTVYSIIDIDEIACTDWYEFFLGIDDCTLRNITYNIGKKDDPNDNWWVLCCTYMDGYDIVYDIIIMPIIKNAGWVKANDGRYLEDKEALDYYNKGEFEFDDFHR